MFFQKTQKYFISLVILYIRTDDDSNKDVLLNNTNFYLQTYGGFVSDLDHGLKALVCNKLFFCHVIFDNAKTRKRKHAGSHYAIYLCFCLKIVKKT